MSSDRELTFNEFSRVNRQRCESADGFNHLLSSWSTSDWFTALLGELGEAANIAKKLNSIRDGIPGNKVSEKELRTRLHQELGDTFVYLDLLCQSVGVAIGEAATEVFNSKSAELGCSIKLSRPAVSAGSEPPQTERDGINGKRWENIANEVLDGGEFRCHMIPESRRELKERIVDALVRASAPQPTTRLTAEQVRRMIPDTQWKQYEDAVEKAESVGAFKQLKNAEAVIGRFFIKVAVFAQPKEPQ